MFLPLALTSIATRQVGGAARSIFLRVRESSKLFGGWMLGIDVCMTAASKRAQRSPFDCVWFVAFSRKTPIGVQAVVVVCAGTGGGGGDGDGSESGMISACAAGSLCITVDAFVAQPTMPAASTATPPMCRLRRKCAAVANAISERNHIANLVRARSLLRRQRRRAPEGAAGLDRSAQSRRAATFASGHSGITRRMSRKCHLLNGAS